MIKMLKTDWLSISRRRWLHSLFILIAYTFTLVAFNTGKTQSSGDVIDRLIAIIGDEVILESEVFQNAQTIALQQGQHVLRDPEKMDQLKTEVMQEMINQKILLAKAREDSIVIDSREIDRELENRLQSIIQNVGSEEKLEELYGYSIRRIRREFRSVVEEGLLVDRVKYAYLQDIRITRAEIEQYFRDHPDEFPQMEDAIEIAHILRETGSSDAAEARASAFADSIYETIKAGESFDSLVVKVSDDQTTVPLGGAIGWTERGDLIASYEEIAFALQPGEISRPVLTRYGYHIIRLDSRREEKIHTSHILIVPEQVEDDDLPIQDFLLSLSTQLTEGKPFEELAEEHSHDLESAKNGGYLGWFALEDMPVEFKESLKDLPAGEISQPFKSQYGYHLVEVLSRRDARAITLDQDWELVSQRTLAAKRELAFTNWLSDLKERYYIEIKGAG
ncbi:hypothetical protein CEE37_04630 [candidate division LCP-89 bacterium B3_LCP]|uniref:PpiC domain-containing protein n=1 Tax=candidate division LCP-89 bacterium B3_LCP TaxID=2012998 RepID=A0A532V3Y4_UNCL8|nr:MAG: hypothetical protein CEE37_04630 [candidate division LCP-89 bacterium B3_LCP]